MASAASNLGPDALTAVGDGSRHDFGSVRRDERVALPSLLPEFALADRGGSGASSPRSGMHLGRRATVFSPNRVWRPCVVVSERASPPAVRVHYEGFHPQWDEWIQTDSARLRWSPADDPYSAAALEQRFSRSAGIPRRLSAGDALQDAPDRFFEHLVVVDEAFPAVSGAAELGPQLVYQYPQDEPVGVQELGSFCLPRERGSAHWAADQATESDTWRQYVVSPPLFGEEAWVFSLHGDSISSPLYGICVAVPVPTDAPLSFSFSQQHSETAPRREGDGEKAKEKRTLLRRCFCVLTYQPFFAFFTELLRQICSVEKTRWLQSGGEAMLWGTDSSATDSIESQMHAGNQSATADRTPPEGVPPQPELQQDAEAQPQTVSVVECTFSEEGSLGLKLNEHPSSGRGLIVRINPGTQAEQHPQLRKGLLLRRVADKDVSKLPYSDLLPLLKESKQRPITLQFDAEVNAAEKAAEDVASRGNEVEPKPEPEPQPEPEADALPEPEPPSEPEANVLPKPERAIELGERVRVLPRERAEVACGLVGIKWNATRAKRTGTVGTVVETKGSGAILRLSIKFEDAVHDSDGQLLRIDTQNIVFPSAALELERVAPTAAGHEQADVDEANPSTVDSVVKALAAAHATALAGALDQLRSQSPSMMRVEWGVPSVDASRADHVVEVALEKTATGTGLHICSEGKIARVRTAQARLAGVKEGAKICSINEQAVATKDDIVRELSQIEVGETVTFGMVMTSVDAGDEVEVINGSTSPDKFLSRHVGDSGSNSHREFVFDYGVVSVRGRYPMPDELLIRVNGSTSTNALIQELSNSEWLALMTAHSVAARYVPVAVRALSTKTLLHVFSALLLEKQVVVVSSDIEKLTAVVQTFSLLLRPLQWQCPLLPVLPHRLLSFLDAPVPFVLGVPRPSEANGGDLSKPMTALLSHVHGGGRPELLLVDADRDKVLRGVAAIAQEGSPVPDSARLASETSLGAGLNEMLLPGQRRLEDTLMPYGNCLRDRGQVSAAEIGWAVRGIITAFEDYITGALIGNLDAFTITDVSKGKQCMDDRTGGTSATEPQKMFMRDEYLQGVAADDRAFVDRFLQTQMASVLIYSS